MMDTKALWQRVIDELQPTIGNPGNGTFLKEAFIIEYADGVFNIGVPNTFARDMLVTKFHKNILRILRSMAENVRSVEYVIGKSGPQCENKAPRRPRPNPTIELPLADYYVNREDNLNPRYTFETFVVGPFNELAFAASQAIIKRPGAVYNPLFVYGSTGHGKTHLIQAIGNHIRSVHENRKIFYVPSEKFTNDYITAVQSNKVGQFKEKYRKYDVLIMDDIQFLSNKEKTQEELFHLFNFMYESNRQIIFSSDKHPNYIPDLEDRLKSRFGAGMIIDIPHPDHESRMAILRTKAQHHNVNLNDDSIDYLASIADGNIRELESMINAVACQAQLKNKDLNLAEIKNIVKSSSKPKKSFSVKDIIKTVADFYNVEEQTIYDKTRKKEVVRPRQVIMYILREDYDVSYPSIGEKLGGRDHTTVIHSCEKIKTEIETNSTLVNELTRIRSLL
jgi:chromosomal replication initiator protein